MKHLFRIFLIGLATTSIAGIYFWHQEGMRYYSVQSDSMHPTLKVGDLVIDEKISLSDIKEGDVISYVSPADPLVVVTHRVISVDKERAMVTTQGDNLTTADPPVAFASIVGATVKIIPLVGFLLDSLRNPLGLVAIIYLPVLVLGLAEVKQLVGRRTYKHANLS